jgi:hypothetical protein
MLALDTVNKSLEVKLAGAVATTELPWIASYVDINQATLAMVASSETDGPTNGGTAVVVAAAPGAATTRKLNYFSLVNVDTAAATATVQVNNTGTKRISVTVILAVGDQLTFTDSSGWVITDKNGQHKVGSTTVSLTSGVTGILPGANGGTGVNNGAYLVTVGGNVSFVGAFATILRVTAATDVTLPTTGTLAILGANTFTGAQQLNSTLNVVGVTTHQNHLLFTDATYDIGASGATRPRNLYLSGSVLGGVWNAGAVTSSGLIQGVTGKFTATVGVGISPAAGVAFYVAGAITSGTYQYGCFFDGTFSGTTQTNLFYLAGGVAAATAVVDYATIRIDDASLGAGATITNQYGIYIANITKGGTLKYAIYSVGGAVRFNGAFQMANYGAGAATFDASGNITSVSDERFKDRIAPLPYGLVEVLQLRPIQHGYNELSGLEREHLYGGFSAQQVQPVMPLAIGVDQRGYLTLADRPILGAVVNAIKTHESRLKALEEARIN